MSRLAFFTPRPTAHEKDLLSSVMVEGFIQALGDNHAQLEWFGSRSSDILRLECSYKGLHIEFVHMVPEGHEDYVYSISFCSGQRADEVLLKVRDMSQRWGRANVVNERFNTSSELFEAVVAVFNLIWKTANILSTMSPADRMSYPNTVRNVIDLLSN